MLSCLQHANHYQYLQMHYFFADDLLAVEENIKLEKI